MTEPKVSSEPIPPLAVAIVSTDAATPGSPLVSGVTAVTPDHQPNLVVTLVAPLMAVAVRFINQYLTTLVGLIGAGMTPLGARLLHADDFFHLVLNCASLAVAGATFAALKDLVTIFGRLENKYPLLTGNV